MASEIEEDEELLLSEDPQQVAECDVASHSSQANNKSKWRQVVTSLRRSWVVVELWQLLRLAVPTVINLFFQQFAPLSAVMFAGHISGGSRELDAASLAISVGNVTGFAVVVGLASAADTLCPQSFGFKNYKRVGEVFQQGLAVLAVGSLVVVAIWANAENILLLLQQPPCVVGPASQFLLVYIAILPSFILSTMLQKYLQAQAIVWPIALTGLLYNIFTVAFCSVAVFALRLDVIAIAGSMVLGSYLSVLFLVVYVRARGVYKLTWGGWTLRSLANPALFLKLGLPGFLMIAFEWWTYEISVIVSGSIDETALGVNSVLLNLLSLLFMVPLGIGTAASVRVGNELGAGHPLKAKRSAYTALAIQVVVVSCLAVGLGLCHDLIARIFTTDQSVIQETSYTVYSALVLIFFDQIQGMIAGVFRGVGLQVVAASINFVVFYIVGLPVGICLALLTSLRTLGMWIGLGIASTLQALIYLAILFTLNWDKLSRKAMKNARGSGRKLPEDSIMEDSSIQLVAIASPDESQDLESLGSQDHETQDSSLNHESPGSQDHETQDSSLNHESPGSPNHESPGSPDHESPGPLNHEVRPGRRTLLCWGSLLALGFCLVVVSASLAASFHQDLYQQCYNCTCPVENTSNYCPCSEPTTVNSSALVFNH